jgi:hypothetical protein
MQDIGTFELLTTTEVANLLRLTPSSLYTQRCRRQEPGSLGFRLGRKIVFRRSDIAAFVAGKAAESRKGLA